MKNAWIRIAGAALFFSVAVGASAQDTIVKPARKTRNVVLIVTDGLRWQEIFTGADPTLMNSKDGGAWDKLDDLKKEFWRDDAAERRAILFPFLWGTVATQGQIFGNQNKGSVGKVTNGMAFSYPGYNEMLTGFPDAKINSNEFGKNPNMTMFEWLNKTQEFHDQVAVFATWSTFKDIFNQQRSKLAMQVGWDEPYQGSVTPREEMLNHLYRDTTKLDSEDVYVSFLQPPLLDFVKAKHPRVLFVGYGETDGWAHTGRYDLVLRSAHEFDHYVQQLWETMQAMPEYRDQTTFVITTDHGRGSGLVEWKDHGVDQKGSENIWIAVLGPDTEALGERTRANPVTQAQIAATMAALLGRNYSADVPAAAPPIEDVLPKHAATAATRP